MEPVETPRVFSDRYELTHLIARGGMAQVYRARDRQLDRRHLVGGRRRGAPKPSRTLRAQNLSQSSVLLLWVLTNA